MAAHKNIGHVTETDLLLLRVQRLGEPGNKEFALCVTRGTSVLHELFPFAAKVHSI